MPRKVRQLKSDARKAGFTLRPKRGKGSHTVWQHSRVPSVILTISGHNGADAKPYQEDELQKAIIRVNAVLEQREP